MKEELILTIILSIVVFDFAIERLLESLNRKSSKKPIPSELQGIYDEEKYKKSQRYQDELSRFGMFSSTLSFAVTVVILYNGLFGMLDGWVRDFSPLDPVTPLIFFGILFLISDVTGTPFDLYRTFVIEERYGFNKTTWKTYLMDKIKGYALTLVIGGLLLSVFIYLITFMGENFWYYFWAVIAVFVLLANLFYTSLILPLFNKLKPLEDGELKSSIQAFSQKVAFPLTNIFVIDGSKRSSKGNAFFSGLGKKKKVVLYDTLIEKHTVEELTGVFAHEVGHYKKRHIYVATALSLITIGITLYLLSLMIFNSEVSYAMGGEMTAIHLNILAFGILYSPLSRLMGIGMNLLSRKNEYEADEYAVVNYKAEPLINALKKLSGDHLSNLTPHPAYVFLHYSHPSLLQRVRAMKKIAGLT